MKYVWPWLGFAALIGAMHLVWTVRWIRRGFQPG